jgi:hypothetical protein
MRLEEPMASILKENGCPKEGSRCQDMVGTNPVERDTGTSGLPRGLAAAVTFYARSQSSEKRPLASSCLSVRMEQLGSHWTDFHEIWYLRIFRKSAKNIQVSLQSDTKKGYFTRRPLYIFYKSHFFLQ